jgi:hypothetical protein
MKVHRIKTAILGLMLLCLTGSVCFADLGASELYTQGKFQEALQTLEKNGLKTASDFYNAANCLYRLGKTGQALAYYEKADLLAPGSEDIRYNLALAEKVLERTGSVTKDRSIWSGYFIPLANRVPEEVFNLPLTIVSLLLGVYFFQAKKKNQKLSDAIARPGLWALLALWVVFLGGSVAAVAARGASMAAVVSADMAVARSGPSESFTELFKLSPGTKVLITPERRDGWRQIRFSLGNVGWIVEKDLLPL